MKRRELLQVLAAAPLAFAQTPHGFIKSICSIIFSAGQPVTEYFGAIKNAGFDGIELRTAEDIPLDATDDQLNRIRDAAEKAKVAIATLWVSEPLQSNPLNSPS